MLRITLIVLHILVGVMAVGAGQALALQPNGDALGFPLDWLNGSPFPGYRFPGLFLAIVIGGANLVSAFALARRARLGPTLSLATGVLLIAWISTPTTIIGYVHWSQVFWVVLFITMTVLAGIYARDDPTLAALRVRVADLVRSPRRTYPLALGILAATSFFVLVGQLPAYRILMVWVYERTESLLVAILMHVSLTASTFTLGPAWTSGSTLLVYDVALGAAWWLVVATVALANRGQLTRQSIGARAASDRARSSGSLGPPLLTSRGNAVLLTTALVKEHSARGYSVG